MIDALTECLGSLAPGARDDAQSEPRSKKADGSQTGAHLPNALPFNL